MLTVENVDLFYGASHTLRRVGLVAEKGEVTCILGRNGVGKTSLLRAIFGLQPAIARALVARPRLLVLDEPTEGIQPSIIKDIEQVIRRLAARGDMAIVLVEQYFDFARSLADS